MKFATVFTMCLMLFPTLAGCAKAGDLRVLAIADIQYAQSEPRLGRYYKNSLGKLAQIRRETEKQKFDFLVNLGDSVDSKYENLAPVLAEIAKFEMPKYHVLGNHDFADTAENIRRLASDLNLANAPWYTVDKPGWRFVFLDTNTLGSYYKIGGDQLKAEAKEALDRAQKTGASNAKLWNGGVDKAQLAWLSRQLVDASAKKLNVVIFAHSPLLPINSHSALNTGEILETIFKHTCVKAYICGHYHKGAYEEKNGVHFLTLSGLCEGETEVSYATLEFRADEIIVEGRGRTPSRTLKY